LIATGCACCSRPLQIEIDDGLGFRVVEGEEPLIFVPLVNFAKVQDSSIIQVF
jgi:hypothetical protein